MFLVDALQGLGSEVGNLAETVVVGGIPLLIWIGGSIVVGNRNGTLGVVWFFGFPALLILLIVVNSHW